MQENRLRGTIPGFACDALDMLAGAGAEPYLVGGAVRDIVMGNTPKDYDVASSLTPDAVMAVLASHDIPVVDKLGNNFGVVVGVFDGHPVEIATFRSDIYGNADAHRPEKVVFSSSLEEDLARRDFTCNAMALGRDGAFVDPYGGKEDMKKRLLRPVGNAQDRYREDPLRMYRSCRFVSQLGFSYSEDGVGPSSVFVREGFWESCKTKDLSFERVRQEIEKMLLCPFPEEGFRLFMESGLVNAPCTARAGGKTQVVAPFASLAHLYRLPQNPAYHRFDAWEHTLHAMGNIPDKLSLRYAVLFHDAGKGLPGIRSLNRDGQPSDIMHADRSSEIAETSLVALGYSKAFVKKVTWLVGNHMDFIRLLEADDANLRRWVRHKAKGFSRKKDLVEGLESLREMFVADLEASRKNREEVNIVREKTGYAIRFAERRMCLHSSELAISGEEVKQKIAGTGLEIKDTFRSLLEKVQNGVVKNDHESLCHSLDKYVERRRNADRQGQEPSGNGR